MEIVMVESSKKDLTISPADKLVETGKKGNIELTEKELNEVSGGDKTVKLDTIKGQVTNQGFEKWIEL
jgi:bacteriocin-like protein